MPERTACSSSLRTTSSRRWWRMPRPSPRPPIEWSPPVDRPATIDPDWLADHPLPDHAASADKDDRGHVLVIGGSRRVPGGLLLTGESALRAGAGRLQLA